ncbi:hypothetical protein O3M35_003664 [Rhynocoris fuscipes]|uniref:Uncharacterized protein n=1 Tax=Rhynocoris fuscipes TaxID=488301 RepID=A0AAW1CN71_9HEMI
MKISGKEESHCVNYKSEVRASIELFGLQNGLPFGNFYPEFSHYILIEEWPFQLQCFYPQFQQRLLTSDNTGCNSASRLFCPLKSNDNLSSAALNCCRPTTTATRRKTLVKRAPSSASAAPTVTAEKPAQYSQYVPDQNCNRLVRHCPNTCIYNYDAVKCNNVIPPFCCNNWADSLLCNDPSHYRSYLPQQGVKYILVNRQDTSIPPSQTKSHNSSANPRFRTIL